MATLPSLSNVASSISSGNFASGLATTTGGTASIVTALNGMSIPSISGLPSIPSIPSIPGLPALPSIPSIPGLPSLGSLNTIKPPAITGLSGLMDATKGIAGSAFSAIASSFKSLEAGVPQNLTAINLKNKLEQVASDTKTAAAPAVSSFASGLSAAGVDLTTGKIPAVDAAVATGGIGAGAAALSSVMSGVPGMSGLANPSSIASGVSNLPGGQSALASVVNIGTGTSSAVTGALTNLSSITTNVSSSALNGISTAVSGSSAVSGLITGGALTGAGSTLSGALSNPEGLLTGVTGKLPSLSGLPSVDSLTNSLQAGKQPLSSLVSTGLSPAAAASLTASMNSLSTSSPFPIKMPTVAEATVDRSEVSSQITNLLGDKKIPSPNYIDYPAGATDNVVAKQRAYLDLKDAYNKEYAIRSAAANAEADAYLELKKTLPQGDPQLVKAKELGLQHTKELEVWAKGELAKVEDARLSILGVL